MPNSSDPSQTIPVPVQRLVGVGVECWRLSTWLRSVPAASAAPARHAIQKIGDFLSQCEIDVSGFDGMPFDPGLAAHVIDTVEDPSLPAGQAVVEETLSPLVRWRGQVIKAAEIVTRSAPTASRSQETRT